VHEYVSPRYKVYHAYRKNTGTIGISFVGGGKYGPCNENQLNSIVMLIRKLKREYPGIKDFTGHKHVDPRGWKIDPHFMGEPKAGVDWDIDRKYMKKIEKMSGLKAALLRPKRK
jgi:N-acetyl-anhydromuramyl-L-alanine amidase AmpD